MTTTNSSILFSKLLGMTDREWDKLSTEKFGMTPDEMEEWTFRTLFDAAETSDYEP